MTRQFAATIFGETPKALLLRAELKSYPYELKDIWIPKSQLQDDVKATVNATAEMEIPAWLFNASIEPFDGNDGWFLL